MGFIIGLTLGVGVGIVIGVMGGKQLVKKARDVLNRVE